jgi:hypothetical protein
LSEFDGVTMSLDQKTSLAYVHRRTFKIAVHGARFWCALLVATVVLLSVTVNAASSHSKKPVTTTTIDPGRLPQTPAQPSIATSGGSDLYEIMAKLWRAILSNDVVAADTLMFPEQAYIQVKDEPYPASDYVYRLRYLFNLDIGTYRTFLLQKGKPVLKGILTSARDLQWIPKGACYNNVGYWHLPGVRYVFSYGKVTESVGVLSIISWRGRWYFIHLGQYQATGKTGQIYAFADGSGVPGPPGSC